jgi:hypothetical protein
MAYKRYGRKRYSRRRYYRKKKWSPRTVVSTRQPDAFDVARSAWTGVKKIWRMINVEQKYIDTTFNNTSITNTAAITALCDIPLGDGPSARDGTSVRPLNLTYRMQLQHSAADSLVQLVRLIIFRGKHENDTVPVAADVLESTTNPLSPKTHDKRFKTKILMDKLVPLCDVNNTDKGHYVYSGYMDVGKHVNFDVSQTDGTDIEDGGIYILLLAGGTLTNPPRFDAYFRLTYTDN